MSTHVTRWGGAAQQFVMFRSLDGFRAIEWRVEWSLYACARADRPSCIGGYNCRPTVTSVYFPGMLAAPEYFYSITTPYKVEWSSCSVLS